MLAAPMLGEMGGGVGQVSGLIWRTMQDEWGSAARVLTLLRNGHQAPALTDKWRFGIELAGRQFSEPPDWILYSHLGLARVAKYLPGGMARPYAVFLHGIECWDPLPPADRAILSRATLRVANSEYTARRATAANPGLGAISVCPLALPHSAAIDGAGRTSSTSSPTAIMVGRLSSTERYKGHEEIIRAWPEVVASSPGARLVIVGDGDDSARLRGIAAGFSAANIEFTGFLSRGDLERRYREASLFVLPSRGEGFGVVYLEAMAAGLACVGSVHDAAAEVIVDGETGVLVDPGDARGMAATIASLLRDPERARSMGRAGFARIQDQFTYEHFRGRMSSLLRSAFDEAAADGRRH